MPWASKVNTLLHAWYGGQETGNSLADVLFGKVNPSGRLPLTFPRRLEDTPAFLNFGKSDYKTVYGEGVFIGYRYYVSDSSFSLTGKHMTWSNNTTPSGKTQVPASLLLRLRAFLYPVPILESDRTGHIRALYGIQATHYR